MKGVLSRLKNWNELDRLMDEGHRLHNEGHDARAVAAYRRAAELAPDWAKPHYCIGFVWKYARKWPPSLEANLKAHELDPKDEAAAWNGAIAATALQEWKTARRLWGHLGIKLPGEGDPAGHFGEIVVRINPEGNGETIWSDRIDPARAVLMNIPFPDSGYTFGDLVLHDGASQGTRRNARGSDVPVFNALQRLKASGRRTTGAIVTVDSEEDIEALRDMGRERTIPVEDWSTVRTVCLRCSYGTPHRHRAIRRDEEEPEWNPERSIGIAAKTVGEARKLLDDWVGAGERRVVDTFMSGRAAIKRVKPRAQWWNADAFVKDEDSSAETH